MKLNFWQIVGVICIVVALFFIIKDKMSPAPEPTGPTTTPTMSAQ